MPNHTGPQGPVFFYWTRLKDGLLYIWHVGLIGRHFEKCSCQQQVKIVDRIKRLWMVSLTSAVFLSSGQILAEDTEVVSLSVLQLEVVGSHSDVYLPQHGAMAAEELDLVGADHRTVEWHPSLLESVGDLRQQQEGIREAKTGYLPQLSVGVSDGHDSEDKGDQSGGESMRER